MELIKVTNTIVMTTIDVSVAFGNIFLLIFILLCYQQRLAYNYKINNYDCTIGFYYENIVYLYIIVLILC